MTISPSVPDTVSRRSAKVRESAHGGSLSSAPGAKPTPRLSRLRAYLGALGVALCCIGGAAVAVSGQASAQEAIQSGEAIATRFSGTAEQDGRRIIDPAGVVAAILDLRQPGGPPEGAHWFNEFQRGVATAAETGQVFGVALDNATPANIYLTATSAFGLHRNADNSGWMAGMWGEGGGPGTVWRLNAANNYRPEIFARIETDGRPNSGASLGNIAFDARNGQLYVSDLETGMIHRLRVSDGADLGTFDHGTEGRTSFLDVATGEYHAQAAVPFDPATQARVADCPSGDFARTPSCWNFADFRRRVWGLGVRDDAASGAARLYYAVWSSQGFGSPDFAGAGEDEQRNAVWSVGIGPDGAFDQGSVRREFLLPDFFRSPEAIARAGRSNPVSDIAFPSSGEQNVMLVAERGGVRNLGLAAENAFAYPNEARVLRYELTGLGAWRGAGRYDVGYYDRGEDGPPYIRAGSAGGVSFGPGFDESWEADSAQPDAFVWMTGDNLCSSRGLCFDSGSGERNDASLVTGLQGRATRPYDAFEPFAAFQPYPAPGPVTPPTGPDSSFIIDADVNADAAGNYIEEQRTRNDATRVGDVAVFQPPLSEVAGEGEAMPTEAEDMAGWPEGLPPQGWNPAPPPPDGWFPPPPFPLETDLAIRKTGPAQCQEGVECTYTIRIRNVGAVGYVGPLAIEDTMPAGATLASTSPGWNCVSGGATFSCITNGPALLPPAAVAAIEVSLLLPADVPGPTVRNCAAIDWFEMGTDDGPGDGNDEDCVDTPVTEGFDLGITKNGPVDCAENSNCAFGIAVTNHGPGEFNGVLAVRDPLPAGATLMLAMGGGPGEFTCAPSGASIECLTPNLTLPPGGGLTILLLIQLPDGIAGTAVENCAHINWAAMTANDGAADVHPDEACDTVNVLDGTGFFDLAVMKRGPATCNTGGNCQYEITVTNDGPDDYVGEIHLQDTPEPGVTFVGSNPEWGCGVAVPINCTLIGGPHTLHPGDSHTLMLTVAVPDPAPSNPLSNCTAFRWGAPGMPADDNPPPGSVDGFDDFCANTLIDGGFDLEISKTGPASCYEGGACAFSVGVTNNGPDVFLGLFSLTDTLPAGSTLEGVTDASICNSLGAGSVTCTQSVFLFPPGWTHEMTVHTRLPDPVIGDTVENCASMNWDVPPPDWYIGATYTADNNPATDGPACVSVPVFAADLAPWGATTCELGSACPIEVLVENRGGRLFKGASGLRGTLEPGVTISSIKSLTPEFTCQVTGVGLYECDSRELNLKPRSAAQIQMVLQIPQDFPHRRIVHRKEMIWPDLNVKDRKPENDRHTSTIMILQPQEPEQPEQTVTPATPAPPPAPMPLLAADLSVTKSAARTSCTAGQPCAFNITVTNAGRATFNGPLQISDVIEPGGARLAGFGPSPWSCRQGRGEFVCSHPATSLRPGETRTLSLSLTTSRSAAGTARNCVSLGWNERARVRAVQAALNELGFSAGPVDGQPGRLTRAAVQDYQRSVGLPVTGQIDGSLLGRLFTAWGDGDANAANDNSCINVALARPLAPPPACASGQEEIDPARVQALRAKGWRIERLSGGGVTIFCGTPPPPVATPAPLPVLVCPPGYNVYRTQNEIPANSDVSRRRIGSLVYYCARPRPQEAACPRGWQQVNRTRAKVLVQQGWEIQQVGDLLCARPGTQIRPTQPTIPACTGGRVWDAKRNACVCPGNTQWNRQLNRCVQPQIQQPQIVPQLRGIVPKLLQ